MIWTLLACFAPGLGAECEEGTARCAGEHVEVCACDTLGGSGAYATGICTGRYRWQIRHGGCDAAIAGGVCVAEGGRAGCAEPGAEACDPNLDPRECDGTERRCDAFAGIGPARGSFRTCLTKGLPELEPDVRFVAWVRRIEGLGFAIADGPDCTDGAELPAVREESRLATPVQVCRVTFDRADRSATVVASVLQFRDAEDASAALPILRGRGEGGDPGETCAGGCKALVAGWTADRHVYWATTRAVAWEVDGCEAIAAFGSGATAGTHRCAE